MRKLKKKRRPKHREPLPGFGDFLAAYCVARVKAAEEEIDQKMKLAELKRKLAAAFPVDNEINPACCTILR